MKTIQIPTNCNPYIVVINNHVYTYKAGETAEVPDEVAEAIEDAIELAPKPQRYLDKFAQRADGSITEITTSDLERVETIDYYALAYSKNLKRIEIPNSVKSIGAGALYSCGRLESVDMGNGVQRIERNVFDWCAKLANVYLPEIPPALEDVNAFDNINAGCVFYCKTQASKDAYLSALNWSTLAGTYSFVVES